MDVSTPLSPDGKDGVNIAVKDDINIDIVSYSSLINSISDLFQINSGRISFQMVHGAYPVSWIVENHLVDPLKMRCFA